MGTRCLRTNWIFDSRVEGAMTQVVTGFRAQKALQMPVFERIWSFLGIKLVFRPINTGASSY
jgi:hypothetical protein